MEKFKYGEKVYFYYDSFGKIKSPAIIFKVLKEDCYLVVEIGLEFKKRNAEKVHANQLEKDCLIF